MEKTFIIDLDDTLIWNLHDYSLAELEFVRFVQERIGPRAPDVQTIVNLQAEIDTGLVKKWAPLGKSFCKERFPTSFSLTYQEICKTLNIKDEKGETTSYNIGTRAFDEERWKMQGLVPGAKETLNFLKEKNDELILLTKGDVEIQNRKIKANNLEEFFNKMYIVPDKTKERLEKIVDKDKKYVWHVGNSIKSDILPAIEAKIGAIYIPLETWAYEKEHSGLPKYNILIVLNKISDMIDNYNILDTI